MKMDKTRLMISIGVILLVLSLSSTQPNDKKEGLFSSLFSGTGLSILGAILFLIPGGQIIGGIMMGVGMFTFTGGVGGAIDNWLHPQAAIPTWVYIVGGIILLMIIMRKK